MNNKTILQGISLLVCASKNPLGILGILYAPKLENKRKKYYSIKKIDQEYNTNIDPKLKYKYLINEDWD